MKKATRLLGVMGLLAISHPLFGAGGTSDSLTVSSGSFKPIDLYTNANGNARQVINIGDPVNSQAMKVDTSSSAFVNEQEINGVSVSTAASGTQLVGIADGSGNKITSTANAIDVNIKSGAAAGGTSSNYNSAFPGAGTAAGFINPAGNMGAGKVDISSNIYVHALIDGSSNTVSGNFNFTPPAVTTVTFNGIAQPVSHIGITTVTFNGSAQPVTQSGIWGATVTFNGTQLVSQVGGSTVTFNGIAQPISQIGTSTVTFNGSTQPVSLGQINGASILTGNGATGSGSQRITIANNTFPLAVNITTQAVDNTNTPIVWVSTFVNVAASQTNSVIVSTIAATDIRVLSVACVTGGTATNVNFAQGAGTAISATFANAANGGFVLPFNPLGWFDTGAGNQLLITTGTGSTTGCQIVYIKG